eukprot:CAMPEP_0181305454 /NCGR_PEP_ID=MMETSP1101-20121128/9738_1 /TAXON_ID=46948 /ORGANISM="Rhodomonas abbreviata, Strain Caron Lab Isolate" /LENGTH=394 /DNA_ID=CAMNT_0023411371 /DNA_START=10 /DNA_END=1194 /DNA_ORIENTATION=+
MALLRSACVLLVLFHNACTFSLVEAAFLSSAGRLSLKSVSVSKPSSCAHRLVGAKDNFAQSSLVSLRASSIAPSSEPPKPMDKYKVEPVGTNLPKRDSPKVAFPSLSAESIRHPYDKRATRALQRIFPFEFIIRQGVGAVVEQAMLLDNLSTAVRVGPNQLPKIYASLQEALKILNLDIPVDIYVKQNPVPNAYTMAMQGKKPFIVIHSSLIELMAEEELQAVIAHELGHLKCEHGVYLTAANLLTGIASQLPVFGGVVSASLEASVLRWLRAAELSCDRASLLVAQDVRVVVSVMMKLTGGAASYARELNPDAFLQQARDYETTMEGSMVGRMLRGSLEGRSHPVPVTRAAQLDEFARSASYRALLRSATPLAPPAPPAPSPSPASSSSSPGV